MVQGLKRLERQLLHSIPKAVREAAQLGLEEGARELVAEMKRRAPKKDFDLVRSIGWTWGDAPAGSAIIGAVGSVQYATMRITIYAGNSSTIVTNSRGVEFQNALLQEFGTKEMPPNPYFYVTWRGKKRRIRSRTTRKINQAIKKGAA